MRHRIRGPCTRPPRRRASAASDARSIQSPPPCGSGTPRATTRSSPT
jgi:hypothetical protein